MSRVSSAAIRQKSSSYPITTFSISTHEKIPST